MKPGRAQLKPQTTIVQGDSQGCLMKALGQLKGRYLPLVGRGRRRTRCVTGSGTVNPFSRASSGEGSFSRDVLMFDVDGVLVSLLSKRANESLLDTLAQLLFEGYIVAFNSGRSPLAIEQLVLSSLAQRLTDKRLLSRVMVVGEKGGAWAHYSSNGVFQVTVDSELPVPSRLLAEMSRLVQDPAFVDCIEIEGGKQTMISAIKQKDISLDVFQQVQASFVPLVRQCLADLDLASTWKVDPVSDSIEIEPRSASKGKGAYRIIRWLQAQGIEPRHVTAFEDSASGISMAETIADMHIPVVFVFTGTQALPERSYQFPIVHTKRKYDGGTMEYLVRYQQRPLLSA